MNLGLKGKIALVTASSQGLGRASAFALAREGATVAICSRTKTAIEQTAKEIREATSAKVLPIVADVSHAEEVVSLVETVKREYGTIHVLVSNAGGPPTGDVLKLQDSEWEKGFNLTLMSTVRLIRAALPLMIRQEWGRIITITSFVAKQPVDELLLSATLRPGIAGLTKILSNQHARRNITINTICPGNIMTKRQEDLSIVRAEQQGVTPQEYLAEAVKQIPTGRYGKPEEIGNIVAFLASEQAAYINGVNLLVDGGLTKGIY
jgi:3-oxoacyl-[acyl-carrier protein] reductase